MRSRAPALQHGHTDASLSLAFSRLYRAAARLATRDFFTLPPPATIPPRLCQKRRRDSPPQAAQHRVGAFMSDRFETLLAFLQRLIEPFARLTAATGRVARTLGVGAWRRGGGAGGAGAAP